MLLKLEISCKRPVPPSTAWPCSYEGRRQAGLRREPRSVTGRRRERLVHVSVRRPVLLDARSWPDGSSRGADVSVGVPERLAGRHRRAVYLSNMVMFGGRGSLDE